MSTTRTVSPVSPVSTVRRVLTVLTVLGLAAAVGPSAQAETAPGPRLEASPSDVRPEDHPEVRPEVHADVRVALHADGHADVHLEGDPEIATSLTPTIQVEGTAEQAAAVAETVDGFAALGMALPDLTVRFEDDTADCNGHLGVFRPRDTGWSIDICSDLPFVLPHEFGHAWERANLDDHDRHTHMEARGLTDWRHPERAEAGVEDVAFVIQHIVLGGGESRRKGVNEAFGQLMELAAA